MEELNQSNRASTVVAPEDTCDAPRWAEREDARSRHEATGEARQGWTLVLQLVIPLLMILLAGLASRLTQ